MIWCRQCKDKDEQIRWLREKLDQMTDRLMCLVPDAMNTFEISQIHKQDKVEQTALSMVDAINADTPEEEKQKEDARAEILAIMGH